MPKSFLLTGLSGAGKTTLANLVCQALRERHDLVILDGDEMRKGLNSDLGFTREDRAENIRRCGELARLLAAQNKSTLLSVIAPYESLRSALRKILGANLRVIYIECPLEICISRDPKKNYRKALTGNLPNYTGLADIYEPPVEPHLILNTHKMDMKECARALSDYILQELAEEQREDANGARSFSSPDRTETA